MGQYNEKNEEYQQRYTGRTTLRVIKVEKNEWEETNSNEQGPESRISVTSYTPVYEYTVNGQQYEYHTRLGSSTDQYPIGKECPDIIIQKSSRCDRNLERDNRWRKPFS